MRGICAPCSQGSKKVSLVVLGALNVLTGINVGFGGILTLGLQGDTRFLQVPDEQAFLVRDSHTRYFGGPYGGIGQFMILAATNLRRYQSAVRGGINPS
jgi:hypothetical protein